MYTQQHFQWLVSQNAYLMQENYAMRRQLEEQPLRASAGQILGVIESEMAQAAKNIKDKLRTEDAGRMSRRRGILLEEALATRENKASADEQKIGALQKELGEKKEWLALREAELQKRERSLDEREREVKKRENEFDTRERGLSSLELSLGERETALDARERGLSSLEIEIVSRESRHAARELSLDEREMGLDAREQSLESTYANMHAHEAEIAAREQRLHERSAELRISDKKNEDLIALAEAERDKSREELRAALDEIKSLGEEKEARAVVNAMHVEYIQQSGIVEEMVFGDLGIVEMCVRTMEGVLDIFDENTEEWDSVMHAKKAIDRARAEVRHRVHAPTALSQFFSGLLGISTEHLGDRSPLHRKLACLAREVKGGRDVKKVAMECLREMDAARAEYRKLAFRVRSEVSV